MKARLAKKIARLHHWDALRYRLGTLLTAMRIVSRHFRRSGDVYGSARWGKWDPLWTIKWGERGLRRERRRYVR